MAIVIVRPAHTKDLPDILDLYNASIDATTTTTWSDRYQTLDERIAWFAARQATGDAVLVAEDRGSVVRFCAYGPFRDNQLWPGYRFTVEDTVHVRASHQGRGLGRLLLEALIAAARSNEVHAMIAAVDGDNSPPTTSVSSVPSASCSTSSNGSTGMQVSPTTLASPPAPTQRNETATS